MEKRFDYRQAQEIARVFRRHGVKYLFIDDIIKSKEAAGRVKDRESLPRLKAFRDWWMSRR